MLALRSRLLRPQRHGVFGVRRLLLSYSTQSNAVTDMTQRGLIAQLTSSDVIQFTNKPTTIYCGVDPTAKSLHLGNLVTLMGILHFHIRGHQTIALVGGATGSIGDPSGRQSERVPLSQQVLTANVQGIEAQIHRFFSNGTAYAQQHGFHQETVTPKVLNNYTWFQSMSALELLGEVGRYARVNTMLGKESVKTRLDSTQGISFTEFSYQLLQAYDFWHLYHKESCRIQLGGSDQWGNITAGIDMIHRKPYPQTTAEEHSQETAFGITIPLLLTSTGEKFGKSAGNAVWLDETMTSVFDFYQFFMKTQDEDVSRYLSMLTLLDSKKIDTIMQEHKKQPEQRIAQETLACHVTSMVHGDAAVKKAKVASRVLFGSDVGVLSASDILSAFEEDKSTRLFTLNASQQIHALDTLATLAKATRSKSEAQKLVKAGGVYINNVRVTDPRYQLSEADWIDGCLCILRTGKSSYHLIHRV